MGRGASSPERPGLTPLMKPLARPDIISNGAQARSHGQVAKT
jgi:hypothetical protein